MAMRKASLRSSCWDTIMRSVGDLSGVEKLWVVPSRVMNECAANDSSASVIRRVVCKRRIMAMNLEITVRERINRSVGRIRGL